MEKRGQLVYKALAVIIGSAIVILGFIEAGKNYGNQETFYKLAVAKDLSLTIDLMYGLPGDIEFIYSNDISGYDIEIKENTIRIYNGEQDKTIGAYTFAGTSKDKIDAHLKNSQFIKLQKTGDKITIRGINK